MSSRFSEWQMVHTRAWRSGSMGWGWRWRVCWVVRFSFIVTMWITCGRGGGNGTDCGIWGLSKASVRATRLAEVQLRRLRWGGLHVPLESLSQWDVEDLGDTERSF